VTPGWLDRVRALRARTVAVAIGALVAILITVVYWRSQPSPPSQSSPPTSTSAPAATPPVARSATPSTEREPAGQRQTQAITPREEATKAGAEPDRAGVQERTPPPPKRPSAQSSDKVPATTPRPAPTNPATAKAPSLPPPAAQRPEPSVIRKSVEGKLQAAKLLRGPDSDEPGVTVDDVGADGNVRLVGVLRDAAARQAVADLVRAIAGVTAVDVRRVTVQKGWSSQ
jgi:hypothetical protein